MAFEHFCYDLLFAFNRGVNADEAICKICAVYGEGAMPQSTAIRWFSRFENGNFSSRMDHTPVDKLSLKKNNRISFLR